MCLKSNIIQSIVIKHFRLSIPSRVCELLSMASVEMFLVFHTNEWSSYVKTFHFVVVVVVVV